VERSVFEGLDRVDPLAPFRDEFDIPDDGPIYLDGNSLGRPPRSAVAAVEAGLREWAIDLVGGWRRWVHLPESVGDRIGELLGARSGQVAVCDSTTVNLYKLASGALAARPGRGVIVGSAGDFPTDRYVLQGIAAASGHRLQLVGSSPSEGVDLDDLCRHINDDTALVCLSHVDYRSGARLDLTEVTEAVHRVGAMVLWDLCHSAGAVPVALDDSGADLAVGCTYKYLNAGPGAPGFLYVRTELQRDVAHPIWGWFGQSDQFAMGREYQRTEGAAGYLTGTPGVLALMAVDAAAGVTARAGIELLWAKSRELTDLLVRLITERLVPLGARLASPADPARRGAHIAVAHRQAWPWCASLVERGQVVGDFRPPDVLRLGPAPLYTRFVDLFDAVEKMAAVLSDGLPDGDFEARVT
jgi:kynureninase